MAQGCFDLFHPGHLEYLQAAKEGSGILLVGLENDETIKLNKGKQRPIYPLEWRLKIISGLQCVDYVFGYNTLFSYKENKKYEQRTKIINPDF